jgi:hypothetical protein
MNLHILLIFFLHFQVFVFLGIEVNAQVPSPGKLPTKPLILKYATLHLGNGQILENGCLLMDKGKILGIETAANAQKLQNQVPGAEVLNLSGKHVYPGFILPNTTLGLNEVDAVRSTQDNTEVGNENPNVNSLSAYNTDSDLIPTIRSNGILTAQITPRGRRLAGFSSMVQLDAWNWEDAVLKGRDGLHLYWPSKYKVAGWWAEPEMASTEANAEFERDLNELDKSFFEARTYAHQKDKILNTRVEAIQFCLSGKSKLFIHVDYPADIVQAILFAGKHNLSNLVLVTGPKVASVLPLIKEKNVHLVLNRLHSLPQRPEDGLYSNIEVCKKLKQENILFCLDYEGDMEIMGSRNLGFLAGSAARLGLGKEDALSLITLNAAKVLGIEKTTGSLEVGKDATLFVSEGDALDMKTQNLSQAWIQGRPISLESKQTVLYEKFKKMLEKGRY